MTVFFFCAFEATTTVHQNDLHYGKWRIFTYSFGFLFVVCGCGYCVELVSNASGRNSDINNSAFFPPSCGCDVTMPSISQSNPKHSGKPSWDVG